MSNNKNTKQRVTMKQIAEAAGTSLGSVDRALRNRSGINTQTKEHILEVASKLGYTRNNVASALSRRKKLTFGIIYSHNPSDFYDFIHKGVTCASEELSDFGVDVHSIRSQNFAPNEQSELLKNIQINKYDGFAINASGTYAKEFISKCTESNIPVITFNSDCPNSSRLFFVGNDAHISGQIGGELIGKFLCNSPKDKKVWVMGNFPDDATLLSRANGFTEVIMSDFGSIDIGDILYCNGDSTTAKKLAESILYNYDQYSTGFFASSYAATVGILDAVKNYSLSKIPVIGYDLSDVISDALKDGRCAATIYQNPFNQGYKATKLLARHVMENWQPHLDHYPVDTRVILKYNVESFFTKTSLSNISLIE